ncbi:MAG: two-component sensor histidine kinase [Pseudonocardiales bacterium]|nr:HAMP domain-containing histidine kinase [Actinomycetota bacterium]PZS15726.1 MAG: two-component sensor histidine kinase [Pseudonocardiales bacterium]
MHSLRARLVAGLLALLALAGVVVGVVTAVALHAFLLQRLDGQLAGSRNRFVGALAQPSLGSRPADRRGGFLGAPGQSVDTLGARIVDGRVAQGGVLDRNGSPEQLNGSEASALAALPADGAPRSLRLGHHDYRVAAVRAADGDVLVTGLPLAELDETVTRLVTVEVIVIGSALVLTGVVGAAIVRLTLRPLTRVAGTAGRVAELPLDRGEVALAERVSEADTDPRTEVGQVGLALNRLLGHVGAALEARQASETRLRRFVADASHELRTPLAAIRGYAELTRRSSEPVPPDIARMLARVESQTERMTTLVEDLMLLARLDAGRPLGRDPVDLSRLVIDAMSDAHAVSPDHYWQLTAPDEEVTVTGDTASLAQVVANLLANTRTHTPPGSTVSVTLMPVDGQVSLSVVDDGPGVPPDLLPHVFERFARGDSSRSRAAGSTGLGLSIVDAVVAAHGGSVDVTSVPGRTAFTVRLPLHS